MSINNSSVDGTKNNMPKTKVYRLSKKSAFSRINLGIFILFFVFIGGVAYLSSKALNPNLPGDVNGDNIVDITDVSMLLGKYGTNYPSADFNSSGLIDIGDLSVVLANYGKSAFSTSVTSGMTITTPYTWTFNPGENSTKGYFWADGNLLASFDGPGPYTFTIQSSTLTAGAHTLGHAWDTPDGTRKSPSQSYPVTIQSSTSPPPITGKIIFRDDFETVYNTDTGLNPNAEPLPIGQQWSPTWTTGQGMTPGAITVTTPPVPGSGAKALRTYLPAAATTNYTNHQAAFVHRSYNLPANGTEQYWGIMMYFPSDFRSNTTAGWDFLSTVYFAYPPYIRGGGMAALYPFDNGVTNGMKLRVSSGYGVWTPTQNPSQYWNGPDDPNAVGTYTNTQPADWQVIKSGNLTKGVWHEIIFGVKWTTNNDGWYKTWWRKKGDTNWTQTINLQTNLPTLWWGTDIDGKVWPASSVPGAPTYQPLGLYRYEKNWPITLWYDNFVHGTSFESIANTMP